MNSKQLMIEHDLFTIRKLLMIIGMLCLIFGIISVSYDFRDLGSMILLASILLFFGAYLMNEKYKQYKKVYLGYLPENKVFDILNHGSFELTDEFLIYRNKSNIHKINWTDILNFQLVNSKHIVLFSKDSEKNLIISETEMDKLDFKKTIEFVKQKVRKRFEYS